MTIVDKNGYRFIRTDWNVEFLRELLLQQLGLAKNPYA